MHRSTWTAADTLRTLIVGIALLIVLTGTELYQSETSEQANLNPTPKTLTLRTNTSSTSKTTVTVTQESEPELLTIWVGGDSLGEDIGLITLTSLVGTDHKLESTYVNLSSLTDPIFFNWPAELDKVFQQTDIAIFMIGTNENKSMKQDWKLLAQGSDDWYAEYETRVSQIMSLAEQSQTTLYWVGSPPMRDPQRNALGVQLNNIITMQAQNYTSTKYVDTGKYVSGNGSEYQSQIILPTGKTVLVRERDGIHLTDTASQWIVNDILTEQGIASR